MTIFDHDCEWVSPCRNIAQENKIKPPEGHRIIMIGESLEGCWLVTAPPDKMVFTIQCAFMEVKGIFTAIPDEGQSDKEFALAISKAAKQAAIYHAMMSAQEARQHGLLFN